MRTRKMLVTICASIPVTLAATACGGGSSNTRPESSTLTSTATSAPAPPAVPTPQVAAEPSKGEGTFEHEVEYLRAHGAVEVLTSPSGGQIAISPTYQGRVMTSAVGPNEKSI